MRSTECPSCPTADLSNTGRPNGPAYSTGELLNTPPGHSENIIRGIYTVFRKLTHFCFLA